MKRLYSFEDAADYLSMSKGFVEKEVREGRIRQMHLGRVRRIDVKELDRYIETRSVAETVGAVSHHHNAPRGGTIDQIVERIGGVR